MTTLATALAILAICTQSGCSLFVMAGKALFGDPEITAPFSRAANVDLRTGKHRVLIVASTPEAIKTEFPTTNTDLLERVNRHLKTAGVNVVNYNKVATWLDDNGGYWEDPNELAKAFDVEYIIHIDVSQFRLHDTSSPDLYQGYVAGAVYGYEVRTGDKGKAAHRIFNRAIEKEYPEGHPQLSDRMSRQSFHQEFLDRTGLHLAQLLYNFRTSDIEF
ncbi:MAG TPA: hypothetical protein VMM56_15575 [Planctomycetaceae bacterium]|nr:hypothetical protein [Planctomycetaceae bacterium]